MGTRSRNPNVDSLGINPERIVWGSKTPAEVTTPLQAQDMEGHLPALLVTDLWHNQDVHVPQEVAPDTPEEEIKE